MHRLPKMMLLALCVAPIGCDGGAETDPRVESAQPPDDAHGEAGADDERAAAQATAHAHGGEGEPRPLLQIMQQLGTDMTSLTHGLMTEDPELVARSAAAMADHAPIAPDDLDRIQRELGEQMAEFERLDMAVHEASVRLHEAAEAGRTDPVLTLLNEVQRGCVACHTRFRDRLRTNPAS